MTNILRFRNWVKGLFCRRSLPMKIGKQGDWGAHDVRGTSALRGPEWNGDYSPTSKIASGVHRCTACQFVKAPKSVVEGGTIAMKNKVIVKDKPNRGQNNGYM